MHQCGLPANAIRRPSGDQTAVNGMYGSLRAPLPSVLTR